MFGMVLNMEINKDNIWHKAFAERASIKAADGDGMVKRISGEEVLTREWLAD